MVVILRVRLALLRVEQVVAGDKFEDHARQRPDVGGLVIVALEEDLWGAILARLDHIRVVSIFVARVAHIYNLDIEHAITDLFKIWPYLGFQLHVQSGTTVGMGVTFNTHSLLDLLTFLASEVFVLDIVSFRLVTKGLEII